MSRMYLPTDTSVQQALKAIGIDHAHQYAGITMPLPDWATPDKPTPMRVQARARLRRLAAHGDSRARALLALDTDEIARGGWRKGKVCGE